MRHLKQEHSSMDLLSARTSYQELMTDLLKLICSDELKKEDSENRLNYLGEKFKSI
jgi:hypothetical protein